MKKNAVEDAPTLTEDDVSATRTMIRVSIGREEALADYRTAWESREASLIGRREVLTGKAA